MTPARSVLRLDPVTVLVVLALLAVPVAAQRHLRRQPPGTGPYYGYDPAYPHGYPQGSLHPRAYLHHNHHYGYSYFSPYRRDFLDPNLRDSLGYWFPPPYPVIPFPPDTAEERYARARWKGDRALARDDLGRAYRQYRDAERRAEEAWGGESRPAREAREQAETLRFRMRARGMAPGASGDVADTEPAGGEAGTGEDGRGGIQEPGGADPEEGAGSRLVELLRRRGERAMERAEYTTALRHFAHALGWALRDGGPGSPGVERITARMEAARVALEAMGRGVREGAQPPSAAPGDGEGGPGATARDEEDS